MIGNMEALEYAECGIPDMLGSLDVTTQEYYERFVERIRYLVIRDNGFKPKYHKGQRVCNDYWTCGNCGATVKGSVNANYCERCGSLIKWDSCRTLTGLKEGGSDG